MSHVISSLTWDKVAYDSTVNLVRASEYGGLCINNALIPKQLMQHFFQTLWIKAERLQSHVLLFIDNKRYNNRLLIIIINIS